MNKTNIKESVICTMIMGIIIFFPVFAIISIYNADQACINSPSEERVIHVTKTWIEPRLFGEVDKYMAFRDNATAEYETIRISHRLYGIFEGNHTYRILWHECDGKIMEVEEL